MNIPKVSIVVPVYNVEQYLDECVQSLLNQTLKDIEIILVDDESPDDCPQLCDKYAQADKRVKVVHKKNGGLGLARNSGLEVSTGEFVTFCDSDDYVALDTYEQCYEIAKRAGADEVRFLYKRFSGKANYQLEGCNVRLCQSADLIEKLDPMLKNMAGLLHPQSLDIKSTASSCTAIYRRSVIKEKCIRFYSERILICEDFIFNIDFAAACNLIVFTENEFYNYRHNNNSLTMTVKSDRFDQNIIFADFLSDRLVELSYPDAKIFANGHLLGCLLAFVKQIFSSHLSVKEKKYLYQNKIDYQRIKAVLNTYPLKNKPLMTRIRIKIICLQSFGLCYIWENVKQCLSKKTKI